MQAFGPSVAKTEKRGAPEGLFLSRLIRPTPFPPRGWPRILLLYAYYNSTVHTLVEYGYYYYSSILRE